MTILEQLELQADDFGLVDCPKCGETAFIQEMSKAGCPNCVDDSGLTAKSSSTDLRPRQDFTTWNNLPVPVLAESPAEIVPTSRSVVTPLAMSEARESTPVPSKGTGRVTSPDSRGGQNSLEDAA